MQSVTSWMNRRSRCCFQINLIDKDLPELVLEKWKNNCSDDFDLNVRVLNVLQWLDKLLTDNSIPYMVIKGTSAAVLYPRPILRTQGNIDVLNSPDHLLGAIRVLNGADCKGTHKPDKIPRRRYAYKRDKVLIEVHTCHFKYPRGREDSGSVVL